jgi:hypothetical protein
MTLRPAARLLSAACFAFCVGHTGAANAADDDGTVEMARQRFREGVGFYDQRQYEKARLAFLQAYALKPHPSVLLNLAQSELRAGRPGDAAVHFGDYLHGNAEASEAEKQEAELGLAAAKSKVAEVTVAVDVSGAQISVDGEDKGTAPLANPLYLAPGTHTIEARSNDRRASKSVTASAGQTASLNLALKGSAGATPPPAAAAAGAAAEPPAAAAEPNEGATEGPAAEPSESASAEASSAGRKPFIGWWTHSPVAIVATSVGVGFVGTGVTFAILSRRDYNTADSLKSSIRTAWEEPPGASDSTKFTNPQGEVTTGPCDVGQQPNATLLKPERLAQYATACAKFKKAADDGDSKRLIALITGGVGVAALGFTIVYYFIDPHAEEHAESSRTFRARLVPWTAPGKSGLSVVGEF